jgi:hypothetical protein
MKYSNIINSAKHQTCKRNKRKRKERILNNHKKNNKMTGINTYLLIITLNIDGLILQLKDAD